MNRHQRVALRKLIKIRHITWDFNRKVIQQVQQLTSGQRTTTWYKGSEGFSYTGSDTTYKFPPEIPIATPFKTD